MVFQVGVEAIDDGSKWGCLSSEAPEPNRSEVMYIAVKRTLAV